MYIYVFYRVISLVTSNNPLYYDVCARVYKSETERLCSYHVHGH